MFKNGDIVFIRAQSLKLRIRLKGVFNDFRNIYIKFLFNMKADYQYEIDLIYDLKLTRYILKG